MTNCGGRLGCQWCFEFPNKTDALDNQKYCEYKTKKCFPSFPISKIPETENKNTDIVIGITVSVFVVTVVSAIVLFCFCMRKSKCIWTRERDPVRTTPSPPVNNVQECFSGDIAATTLKNKTHRKTQLPKRDFERNVVVGNLTTLAAFQNRNFDDDHIDDDGEVVSV